MGYRIIKRIFFLAVVNWMITLSAGVHGAEETTKRTSHAVVAKGMEISYFAVAGELPIVKEGKEQARLFYVAYELQESPHPNRPISFVFNGGPGAASVWLHLGGLGPVAVNLAPDGTTLPPPPGFGPNPDTWLAFTDLVFVDPVGTGFSTSSLEKEETREAFYGVEQDVLVVAEFIRLFLTRNNRWLSPKFLVGESYGTTRVAALADHLQQRFGIELNGIVLVSPVLDFDTILFHPSNDLPYMLSLPTYALTAKYYGMLKAPLQEESIEKFLDMVKAFTVKDYTVFLARGDSVDEKEKKEIFEKIHQYTSLPLEEVSRMNGRVKWSQFTVGLLRDKNKLIGRMDTTVSGLLGDQTSLYPEYDPSLERFFGSFSSAMNAYVRENLKFESDAFYEFLNRQVNKAWDWQTGLKMKQGFVDVSPKLKDALTLNRNFRIFIASGFYDLATPFFAAEHTVNHMWLGPRRSNVSMKTYRAGHMIYTHQDARKKLRRDAEKFYGGAPE